MLQNRGVLFTLLPVAALEVAQDDDSRRGAIGVHVLVPLNGEDAHGWDGFGD